MRIAVLGATGPTGQQVVSEALSQGHEVIAVVRNPDKLTTKHKKLMVHEVDLTDSCQLVDLFRGCDAVLSAIGGKPEPQKPCYAYTSTGSAAVLAMRESGVKRFVCLTAWGTKDHPDLPHMWRNVLKPGPLKTIVKNMEEFEDFLLTDECSDINYTVVRPPRLLDGPSTGTPLDVSEGQVVPGWVVHQVNRADLAKFMLTCLSTDQYDRKMIAVTAQKE